MPPLQPGDPGDGHGEDHLDEDDVGYVPPLPPEDRLWRHPSEVASGRTAVAPAPSRSRPDRRTATLMLLSGMAGATIAVGAVGIFGGFDERMVERPVAVRTSTVGDASDDAEAVAAHTGRSVAALLVQRGGEAIPASAVVLDGEGHLVTDAPTIDGADEVRVALHGGFTGVARTIGVDEVTGIAVLHVDADMTGPAFADEDALPVGARAVAVGASPARGWDATVTSCSVSAVGRRLESGDGQARHGMILLDAPVAPGTAGGALVDGSGLVVGLLSAASATDAGASRGVATPIGLVRHVAGQLIEHGRATHVWLGLHGTDLDADDAADRGLAGGALVREADEGGPAARAGIVAGDVVISIDGEAVPTMSALIASLRRHVPGDVVELTVHRGSSTRTVQVTLAPKG